MRPVVRRALAGFAVPVLALALAGCEAAPAPTPTPPPCQGCIAVDVNGATSASITPASGWPSGAPSDIPAFPGTLVSIASRRSQAADGTFGVSMIFGDVPTDQFWSYLAILRGGGYHVQGIVYYTAGQSAADARARGNKGDFDAVRATGGQRVITISFPKTNGGQVDYEVAGLTKAESDAIPGTEATASEMPSMEPSGSAAQ
jgi:hypothetical protein